MKDLYDDYQDERRARRRSKRRTRQQQKCVFCNIKIRSGDVCPDCLENLED